MSAFFIGWFLFVLGLMALRLVKRTQQNNSLQQTGIQTTGTVVRNKICWGQITVVRPIIRFQTQAGETVELLSRNGLALAIPRYSKGQAVQVMYDPADTADFIIN